MELLWQVTLTASLPVSTRFTFQHTLNFPYYYHEKKTYNQQLSYLQCKSQFKTQLSRWVSLNPRGEAHIEI
jgi:hypothetical protein